MQDGTYFGDWPRQLGAWPCESCLPQTHIQSGSGYHLLGLCTRTEQVGPSPHSVEESEYIACARLVTPDAQAFDSA